MEQDENLRKNNDDLNNNQEEGVSNKYIKIKKFHFIMILFLLVFFTTGVTMFALSFGDEKVVERIHIQQERNEFGKLYSAFDQIKKSYIDELNDEDLIDGAIDGMVNAIGDPYSDYMTAEEAERFYESITSSFEGIGAQIEERNGNIVIVAPIKGSPAEGAGLRANDAIIEVNGENIQGMSSTEAVLLIRGKKGTAVELTIARPGINDPIKVNIVRDVIPIETVYSEVLDNNIGKIQITSFSERTSTELVEHISELREAGVEGLILDLRQNPGGLLPQAEEISSMFVPNGEVVYQMEFRNGEKQRYLSNQREPFDLPYVVVVDGGSASASEIFAAAVQESAGIPVIGEQTFGKGTAQTAGNFMDGSNLKITTARWLTPSGKTINENGVTPDYVVPLPEYATLPFINPNVELKENVLSTEVEVIEKMLEVLGYNPGTIDGLFDEETTVAVTQFQTDHNLESNGVVTGETTLRIMEQLRQKLLEEDPQIQKAKEVLLEQMES